MQLQDFSRDVQINDICAGRRLLSCGDFALLRPNYMNNIVLCGWFVTAMFEFSLKARAATPWYNSSWSYRLAVTISHAKVAGPLTNFPVLININSSPARSMPAFAGRRLS